MKTHNLAILVSSAALALSAAACRTPETIKRNDYLLATELQEPVGYQLNTRPVTDRFHEGGYHVEGDWLGLPVKPDLRYEIQTLTTPTNGMAPVWQPVGFAHTEGNGLLVPAQSNRIYRLVGSNGDVSEMFSTRTDHSCNEISSVPKLDLKK